MYRFIDLNSEQKHERRLLLDWYGAFAQASVLLPVLCVQAYALASWLDSKRKQRRRADGNASPVPSSPSIKQQRLQAGDDAWTTWRRLLWWAREPVNLMGMFYGTKGQVICAAAWFVWLLVLCFVQTGDDYMHLTKRFGIVGASQLPLHYLLAFKSPYGPMQLMLRGSHESLIAIHQLLGRIVTILFYLHVTFYVYAFIQKYMLSTMLTKGFIICGVVGTIAFTIIGTTALAPVRKRNYRLFYIAHVTWATIALPVLYFHVHHIRLYIWETLLVYIINVGLRYISSKDVSATLRPIEGTNLIEVDVPARPGLSFKDWQTGQHAYVSLAGHPFLRTFKSNPFTVASVPSIDGRLRFVARVLDGNTAKLAQDPRADQKLTIEGPYGLATHADELLQCDRVFFLAGGIGATFIVPLYRQLLLDLSPSKGSYRRQKVDFVWIVRSMADVRWALPAEAKEKDGFVDRLTVHVTKSLADSNNFTLDNDEDVQATAAVSQEGIELEERKGLLPHDAGSQTEKGTSRMAVHAGRPNLERAVARVFTDSTAERYAFVVCGPQSLSQALRSQITPWIRRGKDVWFWDESFSL